MKKRFPVIIAFVFGALPFLIGCIQNWYMLTYVDSVLPYGFISLAVLCLWGCIAFLLNDRSHSTKAIVISLSLTNWSHSVFTAYVTCFALMVAVSFIGCKLKENFQK